jgi:hypothetical protein
MGVHAVKISKGPGVHAQTAQGLLLQNQEPRGHPCKSHGPPISLQETGQTGCSEV